MGHIVANILKGDLYVILVKKIGARENPELAIGALTDSGEVYFNEMGLGLSHEYLEKRVRIEQRKLNRKREIYSQVRPQIILMGRTVIIVDDGIATGATMLAAIRSIRKKHAKKIVVASMVAPPRYGEAVERGS